jgi:hypothetical protein
MQTQTNTTNTANINICTIQSRISVECRLPTRRRERRAVAIVAVRTLCRVGTNQRRVVHSEQERTVVVGMFTRLTEVERMPLVLICDDATLATAELNDNEKK